MQLFKVLLIALAHFIWMELNPTKILNEKENFVSLPETSSTSYFKIISKMSSMKFKVVFLDLKLKVFNFIFFSLKLSR